jgi:hypothetical protein
VIWVVEYSKVQDSFYVTTLEDSIAKNRRMYESNSNNDYQIIALAGSYDEAHEIINKLKR